MKSFKSWFYLSLNCCKMEQTVEPHTSQSTSHRCEVCECWEKSEDSVEWENRPTHGLQEDAGFWEMASGGAARLSHTTGRRSRSLPWSPFHFVRLFIYSITHSGVHGWFASLFRDPLTRIVCELCRRATKGCLLLCLLCDSNSTCRWKCRQVHLFPW